MNGPWVSVIQKGDFGKIEIPKISGTTSRNIWNAEKPLLITNIFIPV
jgi:hypothetical protein